MKRAPTPGVKVLRSIAKGAAAARGKAAMSAVIARSFSCLDMIGRMREDSVRIGEKTPKKTLAKKTASWSRGRANKQVRGKAAGGSP